MEKEKTSTFIFNIITEFCNCGSNALLVEFLEIVIEKHDCIKKVVVNEKSI